MVKDMPKLHSPFARRMINRHYVCIPEIEKIYDTPEGKIIGSHLVELGKNLADYKVVGDYSWVFEDPLVIATEKLDGTDVSIIIENGVITSVWNRTQRIPPYNKGKKFITEAILNSIERDYCDLPDGQWWGEVIGPKLAGNPYTLDEHLWIPFKTYAQEHLRYTSWGKHPKTFDSISGWLKTLMPIYSLRINGKDSKNPDINPKTGKPHYAEGIVFVHPDGRMAKLRKDMFSFWYEQNPNAKSHKEFEPKVDPDGI